MINGFCMALADSVPGVSGGTVAFIMGFYDEFIGSIHDLVFRGMAEKKKALGYLVKLGIGWAVGMILAVLVLTSLFESHIYVVSSVFVGFIAGSIPLVIIEEKESFRKNIPSGVIFLIAGAAVVVLVSWLNNGNASSSGMDLSVFSFTQAVKLFFIGMVAISAMFLPGISGSTLLLVFGAYIPVMTALRKVLSLELSYVPCLVFFVLGIVAGAVSVVKIIKFCLDRFHSQTMYAIVGMMIGSFYAIYLGPTTLTPARPALSLSSFSWIGCIAGVALVLVLQALKNKKSA
jgi:putative membrane protein